ncbi:MAG: hypothetical protein J6Y37_08485 [Paludibacteraceae bacterium]|nr:hypothetical protein [Paludibacteraceae bacterium]
MREISYTYCLEDSKSRIPGLFAYIGFDGVGNAVLHKATDSWMGCHGKLVANIKIPEGKGLSVGTNVLLADDAIYSYRTVISYYHAYMDILPDSDFIEFVERGIGKRYINMSLFDTAVNDLVPSYIYLTTARKMLSDMSRLKSLRDCFCQWDGNDGKYVCDMRGLEHDVCCGISRYYRMGGDTMYALLGDFVSEADEIATEYAGHADIGSTSVTFPLFLQSSVNDAGYMSPYMNMWVAGNEHKKGELYTYTGNDGITSTYMCVKDNNDYYDENAMKLVFVVGNNYFKKLTDIPGYNGALTEDNGCTGKRFIIDGSDSVASYIIGGHSDSKLKSFRGYRQYMDEADVPDTPPQGEDWLYYYRKGYVSSYSTLNDELGNIQVFSGTDRKLIQGAYETNLMAYGDVLIDIAIDRTRRMLTFKYVLNAHLKAKYLGSETDDDGNVYYRYSRFEYDADSNYHGVTYNESYRYEEGGEIDTGLQGDDFDSYVTSMDNLGYGKYPFITSDATVSNDIAIGSQIVPYDFVVTSFTTTVKNEPDYLYASLMKEDGLMGISFKPDVTDEVNINRGNYAAFERHIKLSECKTMEDLVNYGNGSFFNVTNIA